mmetsp:Transcript_106630/g.184297  ORF Transcript_106630/g.184297 Transcript_106630/m.184297 type:complete len:488 (+) Transcript_106630:50-1513(+)
MYSMLLMLVCSAYAAYGYRARLASKQQHVARRIWHQISSTSGTSSTAEQIQPSGLVGANQLEMLALLLLVLETSAGWRAVWHRRSLSVNSPCGSGVIRKRLREKLPAQPGVAPPGIPWRRCSGTCMMYRLKSDKVKPTLLVDTNALELRIGSLAATSGVVIIDASNIRGRSGFRFGLDALLAATTLWAAAYSLQGRVVLVVDHGAELSAFYMKNNGVGVVFAGPNQAADKVICQDVWYWSSMKRRDVLVVTSDRSLSEECRQRAGSQKVYCVETQDFISSLFHVVNTIYPPQEGLHLEESLDGNVSSVVSPTEATSNVSDHRQDAEKPTDSPLTPQEVSALRTGMARLHKAGFGDGENLVRRYRAETGEQRKHLSEQFRIKFLRRYDVVGNCYLRPDFAGDDTEASTRSVMLPSDGVQTVQGSAAAAEEYVRWLNSAILRCMRTCRSKSCGRTARCRKWLSESQQPGKPKSKSKHQPHRTRRTRRHR